MRKILTEILVCITPALAPSMRRALRAMHEWLVFVANIFKEVNLVLVRKECGTNTVDGCVTPSLYPRHVSEMDGKRYWNIIITS